MHLSNNEIRKEYADHNLSKAFEISKATKRVLFCLSITRLGVLYHIIRIVEAMEQLEQVDEKYEVV